MTVLRKLDDSELIEKVRSLGLPPGEFALFGSTPMFAHGLIDLEGDVDMLARGKAWEKISSMTEIFDSPLGFGKCAIMFDGQLEVFSQWAHGEWETDFLIDSADLIDGIRFVKLEYVRDYKMTLKRPKDLKHLKLLDSFLDEFGGTH